MIDIKFLPASKAESFNGISLSHKEIEFTYTENVNEKKLYEDINKRLIALEKSLDVNKEELKFINQMAQGFLVAIDEKEEVLLRIDWLNRLYKAKEEMGTLDTKEKAKQLRRLISSVQTCPMKKQLMGELDSLEQSLSEENVISSEPSIEQQLMEKAIKEVGDIFINLGKAGREFVISDVLEKYGDNVSTEKVKDCALALEQRVRSLEVSDRTELLHYFEQLPLKSFSALETGRKGLIADRLIKNGKWNGLVSLDRTIAQLDKAMTKGMRGQYEIDNLITLSNGGKAATTIDSESFLKIII